LYQPIANETNLCTKKFRVAHPNLIPRSGVHDWQDTDPAEIYLWNNVASGHFSQASDMYFTNMEGSAPPYISKMKV
jgi:hypothetical protein